jgi:integrase
MPIYARNGSWQVSVGSGKDRFRATARTRVEAELIEKQELLKRRQEALGLLAPQAVPQVVPGITLRKCLEQAKRGQWRTKGKAQAENAERILAVLGETTYVKGVNREMIQEFIEECYEDGNSGATINRKLCSLSVLLKVAAEQGWISTIPIIPKQEENEHRIRYYDNAEEAEMLTTCERLGLQDLADFIIFGIDTGFRRGELLRLTIKDCSNGLARLHAGTTKSGKARSVPLTDRCAAIVNKRSDMGYSKLFEYMTDAQLRKRWDMLKFALGKKSDPHFVVHVLRHTCASRLAIAGETAPFIMNWMGHSSIMVTQRYMHLGANGLTRGAETLDKYRKQFDQQGNV